MLRRSSFHRRTTVPPFYLRRRSGLFLEIKSPLHVDGISARINADAQTKARFCSLCEDTPTPRLHGISAMVQRLGFYCMYNATCRTTPYYVSRETGVTDRAPLAAKRWDTDITTEDGYQRFMAVINDVKEQQHYKCKIMAVVLGRIKNVCCRGSNTDMFYR